MMKNDDEKYDEKTRQILKAIPNLQIEEQVENVLLGKLNLRGIIYHVGDSPVNGHYVSSVKRNNTWYTCNDTECDSNSVKLGCVKTD